jgi:hypothetical protein
MDRRLEHVRLLAIFHFVYAGIVLLASLVPIVWLTAASAWWPELAAEARHDADYGPLLAGGALGAAAAGVGVIVAWIWAAAVVVAGRSLLTRQRHTYCLVVAGIACVNVPLGTLLGVATLVLLNREEIRALFETTGPAASQD